VVRQGITCNS